MVRVTEDSLVWRTPCGMSEEAELHIQVYLDGDVKVYTARMSGNGRYMAEFPAVSGWKAGGSPVYHGPADRIVVMDDEGAVLELAIPGFVWDVRVVGYSLVFVR